MNESRPIQSPDYYWESNFPTPASSRMRDDGVSLGPDNLTKLAQATVEVPTPTTFVRSLVVGMNDVSVKDSIGVQNSPWIARVTRLKFE